MRAHSAPHHLWNVDTVSILHVPIHDAIAPLHGRYHIGGRYSTATQTASCPLMSMCDRCRMVLTKACSFVAYLLENAQHPGRLGALDGVPAH